MSSSVSRIRRPRGRPSNGFVVCAAVDHEDPLAGVQEAAVDRAPQALAERKQEHHRDRAPGDGEHREESPRLVGLQIAERTRSAGFSTWCSA